MKKTIILAITLSCICATAFSKNIKSKIPAPTISKTIDQLVSNKVFKATLQQMINMSSAAAPYLLTPLATRIKVKKASKEDVNQFIISMGYDNSVEFVSKANQLRTNLKALKTEYADIFNNDKLLKEAIFSELKLKELNLKNFAKKDYNCFLTFLGSLVGCGAISAVVGGGDFITEDGDIGDSLGLWVLCLGAAYAIFNNCDE